MKLVAHLWSWVKVLDGDLAKQSCKFSGLDASVSLHLMFEGNGFFHASTLILFVIQPYLAYTSNVLGWLMYILLIINKKKLTKGSIDFYFFLVLKIFAICTFFQEWVVMCNWAGSALLVGYVGWLSSIQHWCSFLCCSCSLSLHHAHLFL